MVFLAISCKVSFSSCILEKAGNITPDIMVERVEDRSFGNISPRL